jgi:hypothetical protein
MDTFDTYEEAVAYLSKDGGRCFSRWGSYSDDCAPVAWVLALIFQNSSGDAIDTDSLDGCMSMVVNEHDDVESLLTEHAESVGWTFDPETDDLYPSAS